MSAVCETERRKLREMGGSEGAEKVVVLGGRDR